MGCTFLRGIFKVLFSYTPLLYRRGALDRSAWWDICVFLCGFYAVMKGKGPSTDIASGIGNTMMMTCVVITAVSHLVPKG